MKKISPPQGKYSDHDPRETRVVRVFKSQLTAIKRRSQFLYGRGTASFADDLSAVLLNLQDELNDPRKGVELVAEFFRSDDALFNMCDDSDGALGEVFTTHARDLFVRYASACDDKTWLGNLVLDLQHGNDYGVRDCLIDAAVQYLPAINIRDLIEQLWTLARREKADYRQRSWLFLIESLARQLHDPALYEQAVRTAQPTISIAGCIDIAEVYFESGDATTALMWLKKVPLKNEFEADKRDSLLLAVYRTLGDSKAAAETAWRIFRRSRHEMTFEQLVEVIGDTDRRRLLDDEAKLILRSHGLSYTDAEFLIWCGKLDEAEEYLLGRWKNVDGNEYYSILPLAETMESEERFLTATVLYRSLLESILLRAISKYYHHGVRYLRKLDDLAPLVDNWRTFPPHDVYLQKLLDKHQRKSSFWGRYEARGRVRGRASHVDEAEE